MTNKTQGVKKSANTKPTNNKRRGTREVEEKTAKPKAAPPKKNQSKASVDKKAAKSDGGSLIGGVKKSKSTMNTAYEKTIGEEKEKEKDKQKKKEKWSGEDAASKFSKSLNSVNMKDEYDEIQKITVQVERCQFWSAHASRNRNTDYKCYDDNRVIVQMCKSDYINGSKINVPNFSPLVYLIQLPKVEIVDAVEEFWRVVFHEQCQSVHIIARSDELKNSSMDQLFSQQSGAYLYANGFFINTRKVEKKDPSKPDIVYLHTYWKPLSGPDRFSGQIRAAQQIAKNEHGFSPTIIASVNGAGRNAALLTLAVVVDQLTKGKEPKISEIVRTIREQRPQSVDSFPQYVSLYLATNWLIKAKLNPGSNTDEIIARIKKFNQKATSSVPGSTMKPPTEE